jgi:hypothetical protein
MGEAVHELILKDRQNSAECCRLNSAQCCRLGYIHCMLASLQHLRWRLGFGVWGLGCIECWVEFSTSGAGGG